MKKYTSTSKATLDKFIRRKGVSPPAGRPTWQQIQGCSPEFPSPRFFNYLLSSLQQINSLRLILLLSLSLSLLLSPPARAQDSPIKASVNNTHFSTDELAVLTVTVTDDSALQPRPLLPRLDGLAVVDMDISTDVSVINGKIHTAVTYTYRLQPRRTGTLTIPPVTVKIDGQTYKAAPISIEISQGAPPAPAAGNAVRPVDISPPAALKGQDFFIEAQVDQPHPYLGQQIIYTFRFYQAIQIYRQPQFDSPLFIGFETMGLPVREYNLDAAGRTYLISEIRTTLFPKSVGSIIIGPARLMFPGNIYEEPVELYTEPVTVEVKPLPGNAPPQFSGAVGQFKIESSFSPQVAVVNQPSTFLVAVSGVGNIPLLPEPVWPSLVGWRMYDSLSSLTTDTQEAGLMGGTRVFERLVVADNIGEFTIQPAKFVYFDPIANEYRTIASQPLTVKVIPAPTPEPVTVTPTPAATPIAAALTATTPMPVNPEVNPGLIVSPGILQRITLPVLLTLVVGLCGALPLAVALGAGGLWWWQRRRLKLPLPKPAGSKLKGGLQQPRQTLHPSLAAAMRGNDDNYRVVGLAVQSYLSAALQTPVKGMTRTELARQLRQAGLKATLIERLEACLAQSEMGRYGPATGDAGWGLMAETETLLQELDEALKS